MSSGGHDSGDELDFAYSPKQPLSAEQRIEVLELQVAELRQQVGTILQQLPWLLASRKN